MQVQQLSEEYNTSVFFQFLQIKLVFW